MPTVFLSYRHENDAHCARVKEFALRLRQEGIEVVLDALAQDEQFHGNQPANGWGLWSIQQATNAPTVLVIASSGWFRVINDPAPTVDGKGAAAEALVVFNRLYRGGNQNNFVAITYFDANADLADLPTYLEHSGRFNLTRSDHFDRLLQWLRRPLSPGATIVPSAVVATSVPMTAAVPFPSTAHSVERQGFLDCNPVFAAFEAMFVEGARCRILLLEGEGEHGKSTLLTRLLHHVVTRLPEAASPMIRFSVPGPTPEEHLAALADGFNVQPLPGANNDERTRAFLRARSGHPTVLFFDGYEHTEAHHAHWVNLFLDRAVTYQWIRCVVAGRRVPDPAPNPWGLFAERHVCDALNEPRALLAYAQARGANVTEDKVNTICEIVREQRRMGIPGASPKLALALLDRLCPAP